MFFQGALWRAPFKSFSPRSVFGKARLRGLLTSSEPPRRGQKSGGVSKGYHFARRR